jgi:hypothetical protein
MFKRQNISRFNIAIPALSVRVIGRIQHPAPQVGGRHT